MIDTEEVKFVSGGAKLVGFYDRATDSDRLGACAVLCHGLTNHHEDAPMFDVLRRALLDAGVDVFMFDFFGSGRSDGLFRDKTWSTMRQNLADALCAVE